MITSHRPTAWLSRPSTSHFAHASSRQALTLIHSPHSDKPVPVTSLSGFALLPPVSPPFVYLFSPASSSPSQGTLADICSEPTSELPSTSTPPSLSAPACTWTEPGPGLDLNVGARLLIPATPIRCPSLRKQLLSCHSTLPTSYENTCNILFMATR
ncbi:uncharacterized protein CLUP02_10064 [Colletotrichum lupini]|uniref:Uncharacterized protein n=1 Tax=Colletotrichum lupini TaxID=145971 RepID=A0A9Q8SVY7_9PEZI|nr:uncharacterized protein CLUP02_10064 [Colletotrichum lupini]UQC84567.1 hypothetical protein CLUP02_10064 [Colletotrichum lupini]